MQKKLLLLGGSRYLLPVIKKAHELGVYVITCDYLPDNFAHKFSDEYHNISIIDKDAVLELAQELKIDGIMSFACDPGVVTAAYVAEKMRLPFQCSYDATLILQNKNLFRTFLFENGFNCPFHKSYKLCEEALNDSCRLPYPVIVKPTDSAGSKGVSKVNTQNELSVALDFAFNNSIGGEIIIEEYIESDGFPSGSESFFSGGELVFNGFYDQFFDLKSKNTFVPSAEIWPSKKNVNILQKVHNELQRIATLFGIRTGLFNVEWRVNNKGNIYIMEFTPRGGGNNLSDLISKATGQNLIENEIRSCLGLPLLSLSNPNFEGAWAIYVMHANKSGRFAKLDILDTFRNEVVYMEDLWLEYGDVVEEFSGANKSLGTLILRCKSYEEMVRYLMTADDWLKVVVN